MSLKTLTLSLLTAMSFAATAQAGQPMLTCGELAPGHRLLKVDSTPSGVVATLEGRLAPLPGTYAYQTATYSFQNAGWNDPDFLSLEIKPVNGRYIGVLYVPATQGPAAYAESVFSCAEIVNGSSSSNGG